MELQVSLEEGERENPIQMADAIINRYMDFSDLPFITEEDILMRLHELAQVAEHIQVYLNHQKIYGAGVDI